MDSAYTRAMQEGRSVPPSPHLVESMREVGYSAPSAAADLIDNSISAGAHNVWILNATAQIRTDSYVAFADDGAGMSEASLVEAMRLGSKLSRANLINDFPKEPVPPVIKIDLLCKNVMTALLKELFHLSV